jgi:3-hydroxyanthranilate 3,4-dioxygenase
MKILPPFNLNTWILENKHLLKPPVGNRELFIESEDYIVMVVGGPNSRIDYHVNHGEELFYQLEGSIVVKIVVEGKHQDVTIAAGEMFLLPGLVPHSPRRGPDTIGLVIERKRIAQEEDGFVWYCDNCGNKLHEVYAEITDIVRQLPPILETFKSSESLRTCKSCGTIKSI